MTWNGSGPWARYRVEGQRHDLSGSRRYIQWTVASLGEYTNHDKCNGKQRAKAETNNAKTSCDRRPIIDNFGGGTCVGICRSHFRSAFCEFICPGVARESLIYQS